jgi:signal transduction histidine kinase/ActR/RegA family two-component response regulator
MNPSQSKSASDPVAISVRVAELFNEQQQNIIRHTDWLMSWLMIFQWFFAVGLAFWLSPKTWAGINSQIHPHIWAAVILGGIITSLPVYMARAHPGETLTRQTVAVGQMLMSALLIHLSGGRIETHFHIFGSLAILAFYRDWRVLITASIVVYTDHLIRGYYWPQSVYGVLNASIWRSFEHAGWVLFEVTFLIIAIRKSSSEMLLVAERQANLESLKEGIEQTVTERTAELAKTNSALLTENVQRKKAEQKLSIEYSVSRILAESPSWKEAQPQILKGIGDILNWDVGVIWMADHRDAILRFAEIWSQLEVPVESFKEKNKEMTFARGIGLPGKVWASGEPAWIADVTEDVGFTRATLAKKAGLHGGIAFPILVGNGVGGVIEFFSREVRPPEEDFLRTLSNIGGQMGQFFERKFVEEHLFQSQKMETVGKLAGGIAHEFNSIMTAIIGQSELILGDLPSGNPLAENATEIHKAAERAATLTRQLLAYGRKQMLRLEILDLNTVLTGMETMLHHLIGRNIDLRMITSAGFANVKADAGQIEQVIINIVMNAVDAMPNGGKLTLEIVNATLDSAYASRFPELKAGEYIMLAITDTGAGMNEEVRARLFEPFFTTKGVGKGTGLGLATCHGIVKQSGGQIAAYSEPGRGTTFKIYLPQVQQPKKTLPPRINAPELPRGVETILLVEDDPSLREMAGSMLKRLGYSVLSAANGVEALTLAHQQSTGHIDLLFTDVVMPHMSGKELSDRVHSLFPQTKILYTSAYTENAIVHQGALNHDVEFLRKPFTPSALAQKVREILNAKKTN